MIFLAAGIIRKNWSWGSPAACHYHGKFDRTSNFGVGSYFKKNGTLTPENEVS
jgi:hypothetical protein